MKSFKLISIREIFYIKSLKSNFLNESFLNEIISMESFKSTLSNDIF